MATFAAMEEIKYDYIDDDVLMLTEFGELVKLETQELDRYLVLACNKGRLMVDVNGETIQTKVTREVSGKTALEWIREYTEADVRYYLLNTDLSVKEIAEELGFPNLSFFGKFCRRAFGYSPNDFRKEMLRLSK